MWLLSLVAIVAALGWVVWERSHRRTSAMLGGLHTDLVLPAESEFELYHNALSLCSKKVRVCLAELGIEYYSHHIHLIETGAYENIGRDFLAVNPAGLVPVLVHQGHPVYESHEIIRYVADHCARSVTTLVPSETARETEMQQWVDRASLTGDDPIAAASQSAGNAVPGLTVPLFAAMLVEIPYWRIFEGLLFHRLKIRPTLFIAMKTLGLRNLHRGPAAGVIASCARHMAIHLDALETQLERTGGPWIVGDLFTLADVSWIPIFDRLLEADSLHCFLGGGKRPGTTAYWERLRQRPSYHEAITQHGHPTIERGTERLKQAKRDNAALRAALEPV
ncbi:MAG: glutathione S-transferase family protein [Myxococcota bacterium]|nr:glutathione S-transferase family protein [Myxococcota bacterium]